MLWDARLATGDPQIDAQHHELFDLAMELGILAEREPDHVSLGETIFEILSYAATHFSDEEALMARIGFPRLERHAELHTEFAKELGELASAFAAGDPNVTAIGVHERLQTWVLHHVMQEDLQIAAYMRQRGN